MTNLDNATQERLKQLAYRRTTPFCYGCYEDAPTGRCALCFSDDLMRHLPGEGVEWGVEWVIPLLIKEQLTPIDLEEAFQESIRSCYPETTQVGWLQLDTVDTVKASDPISWQLAKSEWLSTEESEGLLVTFDNGVTYYYQHDIESYLDQEEEETCTASLITLGALA